VSSVELRAGTSAGSRIWPSVDTVNRGQYAKAGNALPVLNLPLYTRGLHPDRKESRPQNCSSVQSRLCIIAEAVASQSGHQRRAESLSPNSKALSYGGANGTATDPTRYASR
jgi:hypothetical protein